MPRKVKQRREYGSGSIKERAPGVFWIRVSTGESVDGNYKRISRTVRGSGAQAVRVMRELQRQLSEGSYVEASNSLFKDYLNEWIEAVIKAKAYGTYMLYKRTADKWIIPGLGHLQMQKMKASDLREYLASLPCEFSVSTRQQHYLIINSCLKAAVREGLIRHNPTTSMAGKPRVNKGESSLEAAKNCWTEQEARRFLAVARSIGPRQAAFYTLALDTGMRKGELLALRWTDIDWQRCNVQVRGSLFLGKGGPIIGPTKTREGRTLVISAETLEALTRLSVHQSAIRQAAGPAWRESGLVFTKDNGDPLPLNHVGDREYDGIVKLAGVKKITFHGMRHTCASMMLKNRVPLKYVQLRLGHRDPMTTMRTYAHMIPEGEKDTIESIRTALGFTAEAQEPAAGWKM